MGEKLNDLRFLFLVEIGFCISEINWQLELWNEEAIDYAADEFLRQQYIENLQMLSELCQEQRFILYMFFLYPASFALSNALFMKRLFALKEILGDDFLRKIDCCFREKGESKLFRSISFLLADTDWKEKVYHLAEEIK